MNNAALCGIPARKIFNGFFICSSSILDRIKFTCESGNLNKLLVDWTFCLKRTAIKGTNNKGFSVQAGIHHIILESSSFLHKMNKVLCGFIHN